VDVAFQYREPPEDHAFMLRKEYDELIEDPTRFLYEVWLPRASTEVSARGQCTSYRNNLSFVKGGMAMLNYFSAFGPQVERLRAECGMPAAISGILKAPLDILGDKLRGYIGLALDLKEVPEKVLAACQTLMPHLAHVALSGLDPNRQLPIAIWMHRGCVPFVSRHHFETIYWPDAEADLRGDMGPRQPSPDVRRRELGRPSGAIRGVTGRQHHLSRGPGRHCLRAQGAGKKVLLERRHPERFAFLRHAGGGAG
jgi:hypothetical protein